MTTELSITQNKFETAFPQAVPFRNGDGYGGVYGPMYVGFSAASAPLVTADNVVSAMLQAELDVVQAAHNAGGQMDDREREYLKGTAFGIQTCITRLSHATVHLPCVADAWQSYALTLLAVLERGYKSLASAAMCETRDGEAAWIAMGEAIKITQPMQPAEYSAGPNAGHARLEQDKQLGQLLDKLRTAKTEPATMFEHSELYLARQALFAYLNDSLLHEKEQNAELSKAALVALCANFKWRTDGDYAVLTNRIAHQIRDMKASIQAQQVLLEQERNRPTKSSIDTPKFRVLVEKFIEWRESGMVGPNPYVDIVAFIDAVHNPVAV